MTKVVINRCFGGFCLSEKAYEYLGIKWDGFGFAYSGQGPVRTSPELIACIEALGEEANGSCARLEIVEIPDDVHWYIDEYDGMESIEEVHRSWR